jgi:hypothetical protein
MRALLGLYLLMACTARSSATTTQSASIGLTGEMHLRRETLREKLPSYLSKRSRMLDPNIERSDGFSNTEFFSTFNLNMTEAITGVNTGVQEIALLMARLHAQQHPQTAHPFSSRAEACSRARLLVMQYVPESFEGTFSILKSLMLALAQAWSGGEFCMPSPLLFFFFPTKESFYR